MIEIRNYDNKRIIIHGKEYYDKYKIGDRYRFRGEIKVEEGEE